MINCSKKMQVLSLIVALKKANKRIEYDPNPSKYQRTGSGRS